MDNDVIDRDAPVSASGDKDAQHAGKDDKTITLSRADFERIQRENEELKASERFWADRARGASATREEPEPEPEELVDTSDLTAPTGNEGVDESIFNDPEKWVRAVSAGPQAIKDLLKKEGLVTKQEVAEMAAKIAERAINRQVTKINTDTQLMGQFPDLQNPDSDLFKATREEYNEIVKFDPQAKKRPSTLFAAARAAKAKLEARGGGRRRDEDDDEYGAEYERPASSRSRDAERDRRDRVAAQDGSRTRASRADVEDDHIGPQQRYVLEAMGVKEDDFRNSARALGISGARRKR